MRRESIYSASLCPKEPSTTQEPTTTSHSEQPAARDPLVGTVLDGRFEVEGILGSGGMSVVYRAKQLRVNRPVAIKTLRLQLDTKPVYRDRFQREIASLCALSHPNIVTVYDCLIGADNQPYIVMDYLKGRDLEALVKHEGPMDAKRFGRIFVQVCSALDHAHKKGIIHRDIKPSNIVLMDDDMDFVKVVDFGLAKIGADNRKLTQSGELWGTPPYMSPEQCMSKPEDERSDIYSLGAVMYEALTGLDPFHNALSVFELIQTHVTKPPPPFAETNPQVHVPVPVQDVVFKCMAKAPADRYQNVVELQDAIVQACASIMERDAVEALHQLALQARTKTPAIQSPAGKVEAAAQSISQSEEFRRALDPMGGVTPSEFLRPSTPDAKSEPAHPSPSSPVQPPRAVDNQAAAVSRIRDMRQEMPRSPFQKLKAPLTVAAVFVSGIAMTIAVTRFPANSNAPQPAKQVQAPASSNAPAAAPKPIAAETAAPPAKAESEVPHKPAPNAVPPPAHSVAKAHETPAHEAVAREHRVHHTAQPAKPKPPAAKHAASGAAKSSSSDPWSVLNKMR